MLTTFCNWCSFWLWTTFSSANWSCCASRQHRFYASSENKSSCEQCSKAFTWDAVS